MAVTIDIDVKAGSAMSKIALLRGQLTQLEDKLDGLDDLDIDFDQSLSKIASEVQELMDGIDRLEQKMDDFSADMKAAAQEWDDIDPSFTGPDGDSDTGGGGGGPPDSGGRSGMFIPTLTTDGGNNFTARNVADSLTDTLDMDADINLDSLRGLSRTEVNETIAQALADARGGRGRNLGVFSTPNELLFDSDGFLGGRDDAPDLRTQLREGFLNVDLDKAIEFDLDPQKWFDAKLSRMFDDRGLQNLRSGLDSFERKLSTLKPSFREYRNLLATVLPMLAVLAAGALGAAAALGSLGVAAGSIVGLGLLGDAETMTGAMNNMKDTVQDTKEALFETFQPTSQVFAPVAERILAQVPRELDGVARSMEGLVLFEDSISRFISNFASGLQTLINFVVANEAAIGNLANAAASVVGSAILGFFEKLIEFTYQNWNLLLNLAAVLIDFASILFNVSVLVARMVAALRPLVDVFAAIIDALLNNGIIAGLISFVAVTTVLGFYVGKLVVALVAMNNALGLTRALLLFLGSGSVIAGVVSFFTTVKSYAVAATIALYEMYGAAVAASAALAATGIGALVVGGGLLAAGSVMNSIGGDGALGSRNFSPASAANSRTIPGSGGPTVVNNNRDITINAGGQMSRPQENRMRDTALRVAAERTERDTP